MKDLPVAADTPSGHSVSRTVRVKIPGLAEEYPLGYIEVDMAVAAAMYRLHHKREGWRGKPPTQEEVSRWLPRACDALALKFLWDLPTWISTVQWEEEQETLPTPPPPEMLEDLELFIKQRDSFADSSLRTGRPSGSHAASPQAAPDRIDIDLKISADTKTRRSVWGSDRTHQIGVLTVSFGALIGAWDALHPELPLETNKARARFQSFKKVIPRQVIESLFGAILYSDERKDASEEALTDADFSKRFDLRLNRGLAYVRLLVFLSRPVRVLMPDAPPLRMDPESVDVQGGQRPRSLGEYLAVAIETGDGKALAAIDRLFRERTKKKPKENNWNHILRVYDATHGQLKPLHRSLRTDRASVRKELSAISATAIGRRLVAAELLDPWVDSDPMLLKRLSASTRRSRSTRLHLDEITALLVAAENEVAAGTLLAKANSRPAATTKGLRSSVSK